MNRVMMQKEEEKLTSDHEGNIVYIYLCKLQAKAVVPVPDATPVPANGWTFG